MTQTPREIDASTAKSWLDRGEAILIDVREAGEHARENIAGAKLVPLSSFDPAKVPGAPGKRLVVHCLSGRRATDAQNRLAAAGIDAIVLTGGIAFDQLFVELIRRRVEFLGRLIVLPGEDEMTALAQGALRVLRGEEEPKQWKHAGGNA